MHLISVNIQPTNQPTTTTTTPWSRVLLEKLMVTQLPKKFPAFYETRSFITVFTRPRPPWGPHIFGCQLPSIPGGRLFHPQPEDAPCLTHADPHIMTFDFCTLIFSATECFWGPLASYRIGTCFLFTGVRTTTAWSYRSPATSAEVKNGRCFISHNLTSFPIHKEWNV